MKRSPQFPHLYWLSVSGRDAWLGGLHAAGASFDDAFAEARRRGLVPAGSVRGIEITEITPGTDLWTFYDAKTLEAIGGDAVAVKWDAEK